MQNDFLPGKPAPKLKPTPEPSENKPSSEQPVPFQTPDQASQHDRESVTIPPVPPRRPLTKDSKGGRFNLTWPPTRKEIWVLCIALVVVAFGVAGFIMLNKPEVTETVATVHSVKQAAPKPTTVASTLSGLPVEPEINQRPVVGAMIENSKEARPQSGLSDAGVVFEAIAEGGITRFLALYQDKQPTNLGPIRSARPYYVQWNESFNAAYVHVGGSPDALQNIKDWKVQDINQFYNGSAFRREKSRASPHNVYSSVVDLANLATQKGYKSTFTGFSRKAAKAVAQPSASAIDLSISSKLYNVHYDYDATTNTYKRSEGGAAHIDNNTGGQLAPSVVIAMAVPMSAGGRTAQGGSYSNYQAVGTGAAYIFQDGTMTSVTWNKPSTTAQIAFTDASGKPVKLNPGQTWISAVTSTAKVTYK